MANVAKIDANDRPTWLAYNETTGLTETVYVDPITNVLYVYNAGAEVSSPATLNTAKIDANDNPTQLAYNETTGKIEALRCTTTGALIIKVV